MNKKRIKTFLANWFSMFGIFMGIILVALVLCFLGAGVLVLLESYIGAIGICVLAVLFTCSFVAVLYAKDKDKELQQEAESTRKNYQ